MAKYRGVRKAVFVEQVEEALEVEGHQFAVVRNETDLTKFDVLVKYKFQIVDKVNKKPLSFEDASTLAVSAKEAFEQMVNIVKEVK